jgi:HEAT repeat protein
MTTDFEFALAQLANESRPIVNINLTHLSDLSRTQAEEYRTVWNTLSPERRCEIVNAMVEQAETDIHLNFHAILRSCLDDAQADVRRLAIEGLWEDERPSLIQPLLKLLEDDAESEVRAVAATSLGRFVLLGALGEIDRSLTRRVESALRAAWSRGNEAVDVRRRALEGLAYSEDADVQSFIESAYFDEDEAMRQSALFAMGRTADPRWARYILAELTSVSAPMRFEAAVSAGELRLASAVRILVSLLDDSDSSVREAAALALGKVGGKEAQRALHRAADSEEDRLAEAAREALEELAFHSDEMDEGALMDYTPEHSHSDAEYDGAAWDEELEADDENYDEEFSSDDDDGDDWDAAGPGFAVRAGEEELDDLRWVDEEEGYEDLDDENR